MPRRCLLLLFCLLLPASAGVAAEILHCRTPDGREVFTDDPAAVPPDCRPVDEKPGRGTLNIIPAERTPTTPEPAAPEESAAPAKAAERSFFSWQARAESLVSRYDDAQRKRYTAVIAQKQRQAIQTLEAIQAEKRDLLEALGASGLDRDERDRIRRILEKIPAS